MKVTVEIPDNCLTTMQECGFSKRTCEIVFKRYLSNVMNYEDGQFEIDFYYWLDGLDEKRLEEIKKGKEE